MSEAVTRLRRTLVERIVQGPGKASSAVRRAAFERASVPAPAAALVDKVASEAWNISDDDVAAAKQAGLSEDEILEIGVCAACGQAARQLEAGLAALEAALAKEPSA
ncbi:MAG: hypothetical protein E6J90_11645 [Deltaproteobacteria bacterium]|nr:MAG: hypothetical protein E6J91_20050 [Deltaproteobacteria bacterium]TMQ22923.1 MAG: hypothetical protein E6J90_11645 [Deltaproteobacteria bacterium]